MNVSLARTSTGRAADTTPVRATTAIRNVARWRPERGRCWVFTGVDSVMRLNVDAAPRRVTPRSDRAHTASRWHPTPAPAGPARPDRSRRDRDRRVAGDRCRDRDAVRHGRAHAWSCTTGADRQAAKLVVGAIETSAAARPIAIQPISTARARSTQLFAEADDRLGPGRHPRQQRRAELPAPPARRDLAGRMAGDVPRQPRVDVPVHAGSRPP